MEGEEKGRDGGGGGRRRDGGGEERRDGEEWKLRPPMEHW